MRTAALVAFLSLAALGWAGPDAAQERQLKAANAYLEKGREQLERTAKLETNASRLDALDRALYLLKRARSTAGTAAELAEFRDSVDTETVRALDDQAEIYYARKSLTLAAKRTQEAMAIRPDDARAKQMADLIERAKSTDVWSNVGTVAARRIDQRRFAAGVPLRDRGFITRR
jgi:hypothetical protein